MPFVRVLSVMLVLVGLLGCARTGLLLPPEPAVPAVAGSAADPPRRAANARRVARIPVRQS
jgi:hypothetical protein